MKAPKVKILQLAFLLIPALLLSCSNNNDQEKKIETETIARNQPQSPEISREFEIQNGDTIWTMAEQMPQFKGGDSELLNYILANVKYPQAAKESGKEGRVIVRFCVDKEGSVKNASILRGAEPELDKEALRVVNSLPSFEKVGYKNGKPVSVWYNIPINFALK